MKKGLFLFVLLPLALCLCLQAGAKETVLYENGFASDEALSDFTVRGKWYTEDGKLCLPAGKSSSGSVLYTLPETYRNRPYKVEVDYYGRTTQGGLLIGATGPTLTKAPSYFHGYTATTTANAQRGLLVSFNESGGWGTTLRSGLDTITDRDVHLSVTVYPDSKTFLYRITSLDGKKQFFAVTYTLQTVDEEQIYDAFSGIVGIRRAYTCGGSFDNFRISVFEPDEVPPLSDKALGDNFTLTADLACGDRALCYFGMTDPQNGYVAEISKSEETLRLFRITEGEYTWLGERRIPVSADKRTFKVSVADGVTAVYYDAYQEGENAYPLIEMRLPVFAGKYGFLCFDSTFTDVKTGLPAVFSGETYLNPVAWGADPDILYYDGVYYLYNRNVVGNTVFQVYTSTDMVHWSSGTPALTWDKEFSSSAYSLYSKYQMNSPNVFYYDGLFYMIYQAHVIVDDGNDHKARLFCSTSTSPLGPFTGISMIHDVTEIGGHPFIDEDGKVYLTLCRFDYGSNLYMEEVTVQNGTITPKPETLTMILYPTEDYEVNGRGRTCEGGVPVKHNGYYYMFYAPGSYKLHYGEAYAVSENILGPYVRYKYNSVLTYNAAVDGVGDAVVIPSPDGSELFFVYHCHNAVGTLSPRMTCIDRIKFVEDPNGGPDLVTVYGPTTTPQPMPSASAPRKVRTYDDIFTDIPASLWAYPYVKAAYEMGLVGGMTETTFSPDSAFTVAQAITAAANMHAAFYGRSVAPLAGGAWYAPYVQYCLTNGIITPTQFEDLERSITRAEMAVLFANLFPESRYFAVRNGSFSDLPADDASAGAILRLYNAGILNGNGDGTYRPDDAITRGEACVIFSKVQDASLRTKP